MPLLTWPGYVADKYDVSAEESAERANQRVRKAAEDAFRDTVIGYDSVTPEDTRIQLKGGKPTMPFPGMASFHHLEGQPLSVRHERTDW